MQYKVSIDRSTHETTVRRHTEPHKLTVMSGDSKGVDAVCIYIEALNFLCDICAVL
jgi:hypothetical protein